MTAHATYARKAIELEPCAPLDDREVLFALLMAAARFDPTWPAEVAPRDVFVDVRTTVVADGTSHA